MHMGTVSKQIKQKINKIRYLAFSYKSSTVCSLTQMFQYSDGSVDVSRNKPDLNYVLLRCPYAMRTHIVMTKPADRFVPGPSNIWHL